MAHNCTAARRRKRRAWLKWRLVLLLQPVSVLDTQSITGAVAAQEPGLDEKSE